MYIPSSLLTQRDAATCALNSVLSKRDLTDTAKSFKSWDTCMDNTVCKIVAIVGIVLCCLICLWILIAIIRCCCAGISTLSACCFCCCSDRHHSMDPPQFVNHHHQPIYNPPAYQPSYARDASPPPPPPSSAPGVGAQRYNNDYDYGYVGNYGDHRPPSAYYPPDNSHYYNSRDSMEMNNFSHPKQDNKDPFDPSHGRHAYF